MIIGVGVDIVKIDRFENMQEKTRFMERVFSVHEQEYLTNKGAQSMAGLFAAKEAIAKALGTGFRGFAPCEIEILHDKNGKPLVKLYGKAQEIVNSLASKGQGDGSLSCATQWDREPSPCPGPPSFSIHISISHSQTDAIAFAILSML